MTLQELIERLRKSGFVGIALSVTDKEIAGAISDQSATSADVDQLIEALFAQHVAAVDTRLAALDAERALLLKRKTAQALATK